MMQPRFPRGGCAAAASTAPNNNPTISRSRLPEAGSVVSGNTAVKRFRSIGNPGCHGPVLLLLRLIGPNQNQTNCGSGQQGPILLLPLIRHSKNRTNCGAQAG